MPAAPTSRDALLEAAYAAAVAGEWDRVRMADVATAAGVSRQTLYNEFGSKDALAVALAMRETDRFLEGTEAALRGAVADGEVGQPADAVEAAVLYVLRSAADNPLLKAVLTSSRDAQLLPFLTTRAEPLLDVTRTRIVSYLLERWPEIDRDEVDFLAEAVTRLTVSYLVLPTESAEASAAKLAGLVDRYLST